MNARATTIAQPLTTTEKWYVVDATGQIVGRLAAQVAALLRGKSRPDFTPHVDHKIHVIIINADKIMLSGDKMETKIYKWHTRFRTGLKEESAKHLHDRNSTEILRRAIHGMLPHTKLGDMMRKHLRIFSTGEYTDQHKAQMPEVLKIEARPRKRRRVAATAQKGA